MTGGESFWISSTEPGGYPKLEGDLSVPVAVVGGGIAGLTTALLVKQAGLDVAVLEATEVGAGVTGHTTGKVTAGQGLCYARLEDRHGEDAARTYAVSQSAGLELVFRLADTCAIDCDLERVANHVYAEREDEVEQLEQEAAAARRAGLSMLLERGPDVPFPAVAALRLDAQGQLHARKYVLGLARAVDGDGSRVFEGTRVLGVERGGTTRLETADGTVTADHVVLATNAPITASGLFFARASAWRAYAVAAPFESAPLEGMWINVGSPTRSLRTTAYPDGRRLLVVVGEGHRVGQEDEPPRYDALASYLATSFGAEPAYRWSTQDQFSVDGLPYVGRLDGESRLYVATGFGGWGLATGSLAGLLVSDAILGRANEWAPLYDPNRSSLRRAPGTLVAENANVARRLVTGRLRSRPSSLSEVEPGAGDVVAIDGTRAAVFKDASGAVHAVSAACTHMGCVVEWNPAERSWDCPCHGSRFSPDGEVLDGPATRPLAPVDVHAGAEAT